MKKLFVLAFAVLIAFVGCAKEEKPRLSAQEFQELMSSDYNAVGRELSKYDLAFEFEPPESYDIYVPLQDKSGKSFNGGASVTAINIPARFIDGLPEDTITSAEPDWVDAILAQAFEKAALKDRFIVINGGRYFQAQLKDYVMYEDDEVIAYNVLPIIISGEYEMYLNSQKPYVTSSDGIQTYEHWGEYADELKDAAKHIRVVKAQ